MHARQPCRRRLPVLVREVGTSEVFERLVFGGVDFPLEIIGVLLGLGHHGIEDPTCVFGADADDATGALLELVPPFLGGLGELCGLLTLGNLGVEVVTALLDPGLEVAPNQGESLVQGTACPRDELFNVVGVVDLFLLQFGVVCVDEGLEFGDGLGLEGVEEVGDLGEDGVEGGNNFGEGREGDGAESVFEVGEDVGDGVGVVDLDEVDVGLDAVIEGVEVDEVHGLLVAVLESGQFAGACISRAVPEVKRVFSRLTSLCMKTCSTSSSTTALMSPSPARPELSITINCFPKL